MCGSAAWRYGLLTNLFTVGLSMVSLRQLPLRSVHPTITDLCVAVDPNCLSVFGGRATAGVPIATWRQLYSNHRLGDCGFIVYVLAHCARVSAHSNLQTAGVSMVSLRQLPLRSVLLTSGTLSPLESFAHELQLGFKYTLENPHVINNDQVGLYQAASFSNVFAHELQLGFKTP